MKQTPAHSVVNQEILNMMSLNSNGVVEVGCMLGSLAQTYKKINPKCYYIGIDIDNNYAEKAKKYCDVAIAADVESLDLKNWEQLESADCWVFGDTLEHLRDPWKVLRQINVNMTSHGGGTLVACVPNAQHWSI
jgi:trans-aconitate methyltransferase